MADRATIGVTHEITINGDRSWVKFEFTKDVEGDKEVTELNEYVQKKSIEIIEATAATVMNYNGSK